MTSKKGARASFDYNRRVCLVNSGRASVWTPLVTLEEAIRKAGI